jgi:hypothetical protein
MDGEAFHGGAIYNSGGSTIKLCVFKNMSSLASSSYGSGWAGCLNLHSGSVDIDSSA